jgi:hypothetical protein
LNLGRHFLPFFLLACCAAPAAATPPPDLASIVANKNAYAREFAQNAAICVQRSDTAHKAFHGCIDWHSAVHGTWALVAYGNETKDPRFDRLVGTILNTQALRAEQRWLTEHPSFELPYGRAWFLRLDTEYESRYHSRRLRPLADLAARSLFRYLGASPVDRRGSYNNSAWAAYNLLRYYRITGQRRELTASRNLVVTKMLKPLSGCDWESPNDDFLSNCSTTLLAASEALPPTEFVNWLSRMDIPPGLQPFAPQTDHGYGVNYSRSWGLLHAYGTTRNRKYAAAYANHFSIAFDRQPQVRANYGGLGHWVSQFGMLALQPLFASSVAAEPRTKPPARTH